MWHFADEELIESVAPVVFELSVRKHLLQFVIYCPYQSVTIEGLSENQTDRSTELTPHNPHWKRMAFGACRYRIHIRNSFFWNLKFTRIRETIGVSPTVASATDFPCNHSRDLGFDGQLLKYVDDLGQPEHYFNSIAWLDLLKQSVYLATYSLHSARPITRKYSTNSVCIKPYIPRKSAMPWNTCILKLCSS